MSFQFFCVVIQWISISVVFLWHSGGFPCIPVDFHGILVGFSSVDFPRTLVDFPCNPTDIPGITVHFSRVSVEFPGAPVNLLVNAQDFGRKHSENYPVGKFLSQAHE